MFRAKLKAATWHFAISFTVVLLVLALVYLGWYRGVLATTEGVGSILLIMLGIDLILGPAMTFFVYKTGKESLKMDLAIIAFVQLAFMAYGLNTVQLGRPAFVVFVKDRFEAVATTDWSDNAKDALEKFPNPNANRSFFGPVYIAAQSPTDPKDKQEVFQSAMKGIGDLGQLPKYYVPLVQQTQLLLKAVQPVSELKILNKDLSKNIDEELTKFRINEEMIGFLPLKGKVADATVFINRQSGTILSIGLFKPW